MNTLIDVPKLTIVWQSLQSIIPIAHIESEESYIQTIALLNNLLDIVRDDAKHPLYSFLSVIGDVIASYEIDHEPYL